LIQSNMEEGREQVEVTPQETLPSQIEDDPKRNFNLQLTPEERKKWKQKAKKQKQRKRKREQKQDEDIENKEQKTDNNIEEEQEENSDEQSGMHTTPLSLAETVKMIQENASVYGVPTEKKRVYGVNLDPSEYPKPDEEAKPAWDPIMARFARSTEKEGSQDTDNNTTTEKPIKQHRGLRCNRCFALLCRDDDFEYINGQLWVDHLITKKGWDGLVFRGSWVYCQKMHVVGSKKSATWTNKSKTVIVIKVEKTTFTENFLHNPEFSGSDKIRNRMQTAERGNEGMWRKLSLPADQYLPQPAPTDRYHVQ